MNPKPQQSNLQENDKIKRIWSPMAGSQTLFLSCPYKEALFEGTRGNGKTDALIMDFAQGVGQGYGISWRGILFRQTYQQLSDVITKTKKWFYQIFDDADFNASKHVWHWSTGEELLLRYMRDPDDYWNYHGHEYPWIGWEELNNWADNECYERMKSCNRSSNRDVPRKYRATCNPYGKGHNWIKAYFVDPAPAGIAIANAQGQKRVRISGHLRENKKLVEADPDYIKNLQSISDENKKKAWLEGSWDITIGGMFDDIWDREIHVIEPFKIPSSWRVDYSFDWGSTKPFSFGVWAESDGTTAPNGVTYPRGTLFRIYEWYGAQKDTSGKVIPNDGLKLSNQKLAEGIRERLEIVRESLLAGKKIQPGPADPSIWNTAGGKGDESIAEQLAKHGVKFTKGNNRDRVSRWQLFRDLLENSLQWPMEDAGVFVFNTCRDGFLRTIPTSQRDEKNPEDLDTDQEDHCADECGYRFMTKGRRVWSKKLH